MQRTAALFLSNLLITVVFVLEYSRSNPQTDSNQPQPSITHRISLDYLPAARPGLPSIYQLDPGLLFRACSSPRFPR